MKKYLFILICMLAAINVNGQRYHYVGGHWYHYSNYNYRNIPESYIMDSYGSAPFVKNDSIIAFGAGIGSDYSNELSANAFTIDCIVHNIYGSGNINYSKDKSYFAWKVGYIFPTLFYEGGFIGIGPVIGKSYIVNSQYDVEDKSYWEFGGVAAIKFKNVYATFKYTKQTIGFTIGICDITF